MLSMTRTLLAFCCTLLLSLPAWAQGYTQLAQPVETQVAASKIEVAVIFSYICPFCFELEPLLQAWTLQQAEDVEVVHLPAAFNSTWEHFARAYYIAEALDQLEPLHMALFEAFHVKNQRQTLGSMAGLQRFFARYGIDEQSVASLYHSFSIDNQLRRDSARLREAQIRAVPILMIDGRYLIDGRSAQGLHNIPGVADQLIERIRQQRR